MRKRIDKNKFVLLEELSESGLTKKDIAEKIGISYRTLASYYDYFKANKPNKHSRKPKPETIQKLKRLAQSRGIRTTIDIDTEEEQDKLIYISIEYVVQFEDEEDEQKRHIIEVTTQGVFYNETNKEKFIKDKVSSRYSSYDAKFKIRILNWNIKNEDDIGKIYKSPKKD